AGALFSHLAKRGDALPGPAAMLVLERAAVGLHAIHRTGHVHADVSPGNVLFGRDGRVSLCDLGIARPIGAAPPAAAEGTLAYQAPEQLRGEAIDERADLYALALVLYELVTGTLARPAGMLGAIELFAARSHLPEAPSTVRPGIDRAWDALLLAALQPNVG